jgi:hypothetical protein
VSCERIVDLHELATHETQLDQRDRDHDRADECFV